VLRLAVNNSNINSNHEAVKTGFSTNYQIDFTLLTNTRKIGSMYKYYKQS